MGYKIKLWGVLIYICIIVYNIRDENCSILWVVRISMICILNDDVVFYDVIYLLRFSVWVKWMVWMLFFLLLIFVYELKWLLKIILM